MKSLMCTIVILGALAAAPCLAAPSTAPHAKAHPHRLIKASHRKAVTHTPRGHVVRAHMSALAAEQDKVRQTRVNLTEADTGPSETPSWFKTKDKAGYGWRNRGTETMVGVYKRPEEPDIPGPRIVPDSKGAAGISLSLKLGGG